MFVAAVRWVGAATQQAGLAPVATNPGVLNWGVLYAMLRSERNMLWLLIALCLVNVLLAVWRPKMMIKVS